jgi:hypothetical protein
MPAPSLRFSVLAAAGILVAVAPRVASASPTYPGLIDTDLGISYLGTSDCIICHATNSGGVGTVVQPFGMAMKAAGLTLENPPALQAALATLAANGTESDCSGVSDIEQLKEGFDPNNGVCLSGMCGAPLPDAGCAAGAAGAGSTADDLPGYGCDAQVAPGVAGAAGMGSAGLLAAAMLGSVLARRRRRAR